jgi:hypothetical protein
MIGQAVDEAVASLSAAVRGAMSSQNSLIGSPLPYGISSLRKIISTVALKRNLPITFTTDSLFTEN